MHDLLLLPNTGLLGRTFLHSFFRSLGAHHERLCLHTGVRPILVIMALPYRQAFFAFIGISDLEIETVFPVPRFWPSGLRMQVCHAFSYIGPPRIIPMAINGVCLIMFTYHTYKLTWPVRVSRNFHFLTTWCATCSYTLHVWDSS